VLVDVRAGDADTREARRHRDAEAVLLVALVVLVGLADADAESHVRPNAPDALNVVG